METEKNAFNRPREAFFRAVCAQTLNAPDGILGSPYNRQPSLFLLRRVNRTGEKTDATHLSLPFQKIDTPPRRLDYTHIFILVSSFEFSERLYLYPDFWGNIVSNGLVTSSFISDRKGVNKLKIPLYLMTILHLAVYPYLRSHIGESLLIALSFLYGIQIGDFFLYIVGWFGFFLRWYIIRWRHFQTIISTWILLSIR